MTPTPTNNNIDNSPLNKGGRVMCITPRGGGGCARIMVLTEMVNEIGYLAGQGHLKYNSHYALPGQRTVSVSTKLCKTGRAFLMP